MIATFETNKDWNNLILTLEKLNWDDFEDGYTVVANLAARLNKDSILEIYPQDTMKEYIVRHTEPCVSKPGRKTQQG